MSYGSSLRNRYLKKTRSIVLMVVALALVFVFAPAPADSPSDPKRVAFEVIDRNARPNCYR